MILFDTETTNLIGNDALALEQQPEIIELAAIKLDPVTLKEVGQLEMFCRPKTLPLSPRITEITGITTEQVSNAPSFARHLPSIAAFFRGEDTLVAHNCAFDVGMLRLELSRLDMVHKFPWPWHHLDTVELNMDLKGKRLKLGDLYELATGQKPNVTHRAMDDVQSLATIVRWMTMGGRL